MKNRLKNWLRGRTLKQAFIDSDFHQWLISWKPIPLCWWYEKRGKPVPRYLIGHSVFTLSQIGYRFRNDDGTETGATWLANQNTVWTYTGGTYKEFRLRIELQETGGSTGVASNTLQYSTDNSNWFSVPGVSGSSPAYLTGMTWLPDGVPTTNQLTGGSGTFTAGQTRTTTTAATSSMAASGQTEHEFGMALDPSTLGYGTTSIWFRVLNSGATITYSQVARVDVVRAVPIPLVVSNAQYDFDGITPIAVGGSTTHGISDSLILQSDYTSFQLNATITPKAEIRDTGTSFTNSSTITPRNLVQRPNDATYNARGGSLVHDIKNDRYIWYGGYDGTSRYNLVWEKDMRNPGSPWRRLNPSGTPPTGSNLGSAAYVRGTGTGSVDKAFMVLWGGNIGATDTNAMYYLDVTTPGSEAWGTISQTGAPSARSYITRHLIATPVAGNANQNYLYFFGGWATARENGLYRCTFNVDSPGSVTWATLIANGAAGQPPARSGTLMDYNPNDGKIYLYGGYTGSAYPNDFWQYTPGGGWSQITVTGTAPIGTELGAGGYDATNDRFWFSGGWQGSTASNKNHIGYISNVTSGTRSFVNVRADDGGASGNQYFNGHSSSANWVDSTRGFLIIYSPYLIDDWIRYGYIIDFSENVTSDYPVYGIQNGAYLTARDAPGYIWNPDRSEFVIFNGYGNMSDDQTIAIGTHLNDIWTYNPTSNKWRSALKGHKGLVSNEGAIPVYDTTRGRIITFAGLTGTAENHNETFTLTADTYGNYQVKKLNPTGTRPAPRWLTWGVYDAANDRAIFGWGGNASGPIDDVWALNFSGSADGAWTQLSPTGTHTDTTGAGFAHDPVNKKVYISGGSTLSNLSNASTQFTVFDYSTTNGSFTALSTSGMTARRTPGLVYDSANNKLILFGGYTGSATNSTQFYDISGNTWTTASPGTLPGPRRSLAATFTSGKMYIFGGRTDSSIWYNDTWELTPNYSTPNSSTWVNKSPNIYNQASFLSTLGTNDTAYHWQSWVTDSTNSQDSSKSSFGGNPETDADFVIGTAGIPTRSKTHTTDALKRTKQTFTSTHTADTFKESTKTTFTVEVVMRNSTGGTSSITLWNRTDGVQVTDTEISTSSTTPVLLTKNFEVGASGFADNKEYEFRVKATSGNTQVYAARLYIRLKNLKKALVWNRISRAGFVAMSTSQASTTARGLYTAGNYSNPVTHWEVTGTEDTNGTSSFNLMNLTTTDSGTTGTDVSGASIDVNSTSKVRARVNGVTVVDNNRYIGVFRWTSGGARYHHGILATSTSNASVGTNIENHIELTDKPFTSQLSTAWSPVASRAYFNTNDYDNATYYFEVIGTNSNTTTAYGISLIAVDGAGVETTLVTQNFTANTGSSNVRYRTASFSIPATTSYLKVSIAGTASAKQVTLGSARVIIVQSAGTKTRLQIPMGGSNTEWNDDTTNPVVDTANTSYQLLATNVDQFTIWKREDAEYDAYYGTNPSVTKTHTTDAFKRKAATASHTTSSNKKVASNTRAHTTDAFRRKQFTKTHTTDALKRKQSTLAHTTDSNRKKSGLTVSHTADANKKKAGLLKPHTTDALLRKQVVLIHSTNALKRKAQTLSHTTDASKKIVGTLSHTTDAYTHLGVQTLTVSHSTDSLKHEQNTLAHTTGSLNRKAFAVSHTTDANKKKTGLTVSHSTDALKRKQFSLSHTTDANRKKTGNTKAHTTDILKRKQFTLSHFTDTLKRVAHMLTHSTNSLKRKTSTVVHTTDANRRKTLTKTHTTDAVVRGQYTKSHTTDVLKRIRTTLSHSADSNKRKASTTSHTADAYKQFALLETLEDNFNDNSLDTTKWDTNFSNGSVTEQNSRLEMVLNSGATSFDYATLQTKGGQFYNFVGSYLRWKNVVLPNNAEKIAYGYVTIGVSRAVLWQYSNGTIQAIYNSSSNNVLYTATYTAGSHLYLRIRESGGTIYWDSSGDGTNWVNRATQVPSGTLFLDGVYAGFEIDPVGTTTSTGQYFIDDVNVGKATLTKAHTTDAVLRKQFTKVHSTDTNKKKSGNTVSHTTDANRKKAFTVTHTTDVLRHKQLTSSHTTDVLLRKPVVKTHTTDALKRKQFTLSHATNSNLRRAYTVLHTADANKKRAGLTVFHKADANRKKSGDIRNHTTDALKRVAHTLAHTTDTLVRKSFTKSHTTDALVRKSNTLVHSTDANKKRAQTISHTTDANRKKTGNLLNHTTNTLKRRASSLAHKTDALLKQRWTLTHLTNALLRHAITLSHPTDALLRKSATTSHSTSANKNKSGNTVDHSTDSNRRKALSVTHTTDTLKRVTHTIAHTTNAFLRIAVVLTHTTDSLLRTASEVSHRTDAYLRGASDLFHTTDANKRRAYTHSHTTDTNKKKAGNLLQHTTNALKRKANVVNHATDALKRKTTAVLHTTDAMLRVRKTVMHTADTLKRVAYTLVHSTGSFLRKSSTVTHLTDANKKKSGFTVSHTTDANKRKAQIVSHRTDVNTRKTFSVVHSTDANKKRAGNLLQHTTNSVLRVTVTIFHKTNALIRVADIVSHTTSSFLRGENRATHTTDANLKKPYSVSHSTDAYRRGASQIEHSTDSNKRRASVVSHSTDASKKVVHLVSHTTDVLPRVQRAISHTTDSFLRISKTLGHSTDANLKKAQTVNHTADAYKRGADELSHRTDANKRKSHVVSHATNANKRKSATVTHLTDTFLRIHRTLSHTTDSFLRKAQSVLHFTDANRRKGQVTTHRTDALKRKTAVVLHSTDVLLHESHTISHDASANLKKAHTISHSADANKKRGHSVIHTTDAIIGDSFTAQHTTDTLLFARRGNKKVLISGQWHYGVVKVLDGPIWKTVPVKYFDGSSWSDTQQ